MDSLTLKPQKSILENAIMYERVDVKKLNSLIHSTLTDKQWTDSKGNSTHATERAQIIEYGKNIDKKGYAKVKYIRYGSYGRVNPKKSLGLHSIRRGIRHTISKDTVDIDVENSHPTMMYQIFKCHSIPCPHLENYVTKRDEHLTAVMNGYGVIKADAKALYIAIMNGSGFNSWAEEFKVTKGPDESITNLITEMRHNAEIVALLNPEIAKEIASKKKDNPYNKNASVLSIFAQEWENRVLEEIYLFAVSRNYIQNNICSLCNDGIMITEANFSITVLDEFSECIKSKIGFDLVFKVKEMNEGYTDEQIAEASTINTVIISEDDIEDEEAYTIDKNGKKNKKVLEYEDVNDKFAATRLLKILEDKVIVDTTYGGRILRTYNDENGFWELGDDPLKTQISNHSNKLIFYKKVAGRFRTYDYGGFSSKHKSLCEHVRSLAPIYNNNINKGSDKSKYKFLFSNGIYDVMTSTLSPFDPAIQFNGRINRKCPDYLKLDYNPDIEFIAAVAKVHKILFEDPFTDEQIAQHVPDFYKVFLARSLVGEVDQKRYMNIIGVTNSCKGITTSALRQAFESYVGTFNIADLYTKKQNDDPAKSLHWLVESYLKRLIIGNEADPSKTLDSVLMCAVVSGGTDETAIRALHSNIMLVLIRCCLLMFGNDAPKLSSANAQIEERACIAEMLISFLETPTAGNPLHKPIDTTICDYFKTTIAKDALVCLMIKTFQTWNSAGRDTKKPIIYDQMFKKWYGDTCHTRGVIEEHYNITGLDSDRIVFSSIYNLLKSKGIKDSAVVVSRELRKIPTLTVVERRIAGRTALWVFGIKLPTIDDENQIIDTPGGDYGM